MTDYDKVVKGIEYHLNGKPTCQGCVYLDVWPCLDAILKDALALIREQQKRLKAQTPVKHGRWIEAENDSRISGHCSSCGWEAHLYEDDVIGMPYCPNCGAKMDGGEE